MKGRSISVLLFLSTVSVICVLFLYKGKQDDSFPISINDHDSSIQKPLPAETRNEPLTVDELSNGPEGLTDLLSQDMSLQKAALDDLWKNGGYEETYIKYGENVLPYIAYVVSDTENRNSKIALRFLFEVSRGLTVKSRRGPFSIVDEEALKAYANEIPQNLPELTSYPPLKPILIQTLSTSPNSKDRASAAWILVQAYDADQEIEEALGKQLRDRQTGDIDMEVMASIGHMATSEAYDNEFLSPLTMARIIDALNDNNVSNLSYASGFIGKYKPKAAIPALISNLSSEDDVTFSFSLRTLSAYGHDAVGSIPQLEVKLDTEENISRREDIRKVIDQLNAIKVAN